MKWVLALLCLILLLPLAVVDVPPLLDYPNHLARAVVLASGDGDPVLSQMYAARWAIIPNLGTDLVLPPLLHVLPVHVAGRVVIGLAIVLPVLGTIAYSRVMFRTNAIWPLASALVAYNATLLLGFLNFVAGIGIALLLAAAWIAWRDRYPLSTIVLAPLGTAVLFFCHLMGLVFFYLLIVGFELQRLSSRRLLALRVVALLPLVAVPAALYLASPLAPVSDATEFSSVAVKSKELILPFANYILPLDIVSACLIVAFLLACVATRFCRVTLAGGVSLALTILLFLVAPWAFKGTYFVDARFAIMLGFLLFGAVLPEGLPRPLAGLAIAGFTLLFGVRMAVVGHVWHEHRDDIAQLRHAIAQVEPGSRVLVAAVAPEDASGYWQHVPLNRRLSLGLRLDQHTAALLLIERRAFWPFLFDNPSQQPVATLEPYRTLAEHASSMTTYRALSVPGKIDLCGYDHLLLLDAGGEPDLRNFATDRLSLLTHSDVAALFRVRQGACLM